MTSQQKILIFGTSHVASLRAAQDQIQTRFPQFAPSFYGLPGKLFDRCLCEDGFLFGPTSTDEEGLELSERINGCEKTDLSTFDQFMLIGPSMGHGWLYRIGGQYQVQGISPESEDKPLISSAFYDEAQKAVLLKALQKVQTQTNMVTNLTVAPPPWPAEALARGKKRDGAIATFHRQPERNALIENYETAAAQACAEQKLNFIRTPRDTLAEPGLTKNEYALDTIRLHPDLNDADDYKHMNAAYGLAVFSEYVAAYDSGFETNIENTKER